MNIHQTFESWNDDLCYGAGGAGFEPAELTALNFYWQKLIELYSPEIGLALSTIPEGELAMAENIPEGVAWAVRLSPMGVQNAYTQVRFPDMSHYEWFAIAARFVGLVDGAWGMA